MLLASFLVMILVPTNLGLLVAAAFVGFTTAMTFPVILALPALLSAPGDVSRTSAGMFTISYSCAMVLSIVAERMAWRRPVCVRSKARVCTIAECR